MKSKINGCLNWLAILGYIFIGIGFLIYAFSDANEVFGYLDWTFLIFAVLLPIVMLGKLYQVRRIFNSLWASFKKLFILFYRLLLISSFLYFIAILIKLLDVGFSNFDNLLHLIISLTSLSVCSLIFYYKEVKPRYIEEKRKEEKTIELNKLVFQAKKNVEENNKNFIKKLKELHGQKFDYKDVVLEEFQGIKSGSKLKVIQNSSVTLLCNKHDVIFNEDVSSVFNTKGCERCKIEDNYKSAKKEKEDLTVISMEENIDEILNKVNEIEKDGKQTKETVIKIDKNIDILLGIEKIKTSCKINQEEECIEKILTLLEKDFDFKNSSQCEEDVKSWFGYWNNLENLSKDFMTQSEFLYYSIQSSDFKDYSPFILYSCRALEYELLQKIFLAYHNYIDNKYPDKDSLFKYDPDNIDAETLKDIKTGQMASFRKKFENPRYTLGDMRLILNILPKKNKSKDSRRYKVLLALQELNSFINNKIGEIPTQLIKTIHTISINYRNPSAHVGVLDKKKADIFRKEYKKLMNDLLKLFT